MEYRTLEVSKRLKDFNGNLKEFDCRGITCLECPFHISDTYCEEFDTIDLKYLSKAYLSLPLKEE